MDFRVGFGYDVHRWAEGRPLWLGGVRIPHSQGLAGHSDADVLLHAVCDALLGAVGERDIGYHFPDTDPRYKGASSDRFLQEAQRLAQQAGYQLGNLDATLVAEAPKLNPHVPAMQASLARLLQCEAGRINLKATTNEKMGFVGRNEGMAAYAVVLLVGS
jgi:2-C-methyl-D-erythritol 2,4-cyclodiphosphate synthase